MDQMDKDDNDCGGDGASAEVPEVAIVMEGTDTDNRAHVVSVDHRLFVNAHDDTVAGEYAVVDAVKSLE